MAKRRKSGTGGVYKDYGRDRWVGDVVINGRRHRVTAKYKLDAEAKLNQLIRAGQPADDPTVAAAVEIFTDRVIPGRDLAPSTLDTYQWSTDLIRDELGDIRLSRLTVDRTERFLDNLTDRHGNPLGRRSAKHVRSTLGQILDTAARRGWTDRNVARLAELPAAAPKPEPRRALTRAEATKLYQAVADHRLGIMFRLQLSTGLRPGEAAGVLWSDLDGDLLHVRHAVRVVKNRAVLSDNLKTSSSYRTLRLPADLVDKLQAQRARVAADRLAVGAGWTDLGLVFPSPNGAPLTPSTVRKELAAICAAAELPTIRPNELRHTAATLMVDTGVPVEIVSDQLGHSSFKMLADVYRHRVRPSVDAATVLDLGDIASGES